MAEDLNQRETVLELTKPITQILRGEASAVDAYRQVMEKIEEDPEAMKIRQFLDDHKEAESYWKKELQEEGIVLDGDSGPWGSVVETFVGAAKLLGNRATLKALKEGEEYGLSQYEEMLKDKNISQENKSYIQNVLIPNQLKHINSIDAMMKLQ